MRGFRQPDELSSNTILRGVYALWPPRSGRCSLPGWGNWTNEPLPDIR